MNTRVWVDFNAAVDGRCTTLCKYVEGVVGLGERVTAVDHDGFACEGIVEDLNSELVIVALDLDTFHEDAPSTATA